MLSFCAFAGMFDTPQFNIQGTSGIELLLTNPKSKKLGIDGKTKKKYQEIDVSDISHGDNIEGSPDEPATESETTLYVKGLPGRYKLEIYGLKNTEYKIAAEFNSLPSDKKTLEVRGQIKAGETQTVEFEVTKDKNIIKQ